MSVTAAFVTAAFVTAAFVTAQVAPGMPPHRQREKPKRTRRECRHTGAGPTNETQEGGATVAPGMPPHRHKRKGPTNETQEVGATVAPGMPPHRHKRKLHRECRHTGSASRIGNNEQQVHAGRDDVERVKSECQ